MNKYSGIIVSRRAGRSRSGADCVADAVCGSAGRRIQAAQPGPARLSRLAFAAQRPSAFLTQKEVARRQGKPLPARAYPCAHEEKEPTKLQR
ncbi:hypothetical protein RR46_03768 [Papilio xuthus]|uniref:Uncharacterized protein n=1 Tax=Papilio xuthus TaxID=66420 RepID=A0A194Q240_PAPXU|nr:hypothetical protein RR46_03768 [Papilio xuthus]